MRLWYYYSTLAIEYSTAQEGLSRSPNCRTRPTTFRFVGEAFEEHELVKREAAYLPRRERNCDMPLQ